MSCPRVVLGGTPAVMEFGSFRKGLPAKTKILAMIFKLVEGKREFYLHYALTGVGKFGARQPTR